MWWSRCVSVSEHVWVTRATPCVSLGTAFTAPTSLILHHSLLVPYRPTDAV